MEPMEALRYLPYLAPDGTIVTSSKPFVNIPNYPEESELMAELDSMPSVVKLDIDSVAKDAGNARPLIVFDTLRRYLEYRGNKVIYVSNITDIDDKLIKKGQEEGTSMKEVAQRFEAEYLKDAAGLNCKKPTVQLG